MKKALKRNFMRSLGKANTESDIDMELNEFDKLYMLLAEQNIQQLFNSLCYDVGIAGLSDLHNINASTIQNNLRKCGTVLSRKLKTAIESLPKAQEKVDFDKLAKSKYRKHSYREELQTRGVPLIDWKDLTFKSKINIGPFAGSVCTAMWRKPDKTKALVCLRYDQNSAQRIQFMYEAQMAMELKHENILSVYGAVILGDYADSVALVVEYSPFGNIKESVGKQTVHSVCGYARQIAEALEYIESKGYIHTRMGSYFIYVVELEKVKIGGLWGCAKKSEINVSPAKKRLHSNLSLGRVNYNMSISDTVSWFGYAMASCFQSLEYYRLQRKSWFLEIPKGKGSERFGLLCPDVYYPLFEKCGKQEEKQRPSLSEIVQFVSQKNVPRRLEVTSTFEGDSKENITCRKGDIITLISTSRDKDGRWFGEKLGGEVGFFDGSHTMEINTGSETYIAGAEAAVSQAESQSSPEETAADLVIPVEILARGPQAEIAYWRALRNGKVRVNRARVMLVGQDRAGKTSLKKSLLGMPFDPKQESTEGVEVDPSVFEVQIDEVTNWQRIEDKKIKSQIEEELAKLVASELRKAPSEAEETSLGEEDNRSLTSDADVVDSNKEKQVEIVDVKPDLLSHVEISNEDTEVNDLTTDNIASTQQIEMKLDTTGTVPEDITKLVIQHLQNLKFEEAADSKETVVTLWDFAGQHLYYASHPVFMSPRAIYVLVYNLSKDLNAKAEPCVRQGVFDIILENTTDETNLENILSWLVSIHNVAVLEDEVVNSEGGSKLPYLRPPVVIVGTHSDCPHQELKRAEACIKKSISRKTFEQHVVRPFFSANNTLSGADSGVQKLRQKINELLQLEPYMGEDVPVRWFNFEKVAEALVEKKNSYMDLEQLERIVREVCLIEDENEVASMLNFYHDLGLIIKHGRTVVLQAQWLIDLFKKLITIRPYDEQDPRFSDHWEELEERGILRPQLVDHVFRGFISNGQSREDILDMMELYGLIARFGGNSKEEGSSFSCTELKDAKYFVPAQLRSSPEKLLDVEPTMNDPCAIYVHFLDGFLPHGLFPQVYQVVPCCRLPSRAKPLPQCRQVHSGSPWSYDLILICRKRFIKIVLKTVKSAAVDEKQTCEETNPNPTTKVRQFLEETLMELATETPWLRNMRHELAVLCPSCVTPDKQCSKHKVKGCLNDDCLHLLGIRFGEPLICTKSYGDSSRIDNLSVQAWFENPWDEKENGNVAEAEEPVTADQNTKTVPRSTHFQPGTVTREVLMYLARDIGRIWKRLGLALGLEEPELEQVEADEKDLYEKSYGMLKKWTHINASSATYEKLGQALMSVIVGRDDLAVRYCVRTEQVSESETDSVITRSQVDSPPVVTRPKVFISYQWDIQPMVKELRARLEDAGFECWMDINQMGGGDALYAEIDAGIRGSKVVIACVTEKYCKSESCQREVTLADLLRRPIIPLLLQPMEWPPAGQIALIMAKLLYIDMTVGPDPIAKHKFEELSKTLNQQISR